jgi:hypothetical protein
MGTGEGPLKSVMCIRQKKCRKGQNMGMKKLITTWWSNKTNVKLILAPVLLIICNLFLFGPATIYSGNISEFNISLIDILKYYAVPGMILLLIFLGIGTALSKKYLSLYVVLIFAVGVLLWIQGNILVWDYGVFGKGDIDWTKNSWRGWVDGLLWLVLLTLACIFYKRVSKVATLTCTVLILLQMIMLIYTGIQRPEIWKKVHKAAIVPPKEIFEFSTKQNVIHVILDEFQSTLFREIIDGDPEYYKTALEGFTFFKETTGSFPTTYMSLPAILSGQVYKNHIPINNFINNVFKGKTITNVLYDSGYEVDLAASVGFSYKGRYSNCYNIPVPYGVTKKEHEQAISALMLDLVLFRSSPHFLKKYEYNNQSMLPILNLNKKDVTSYEATRHFAHKAFLKDLIDNMSVRRSRPVYKFIHLNTTHFPAVLNEDCEYAGRILPWRWENIEIQVKCSFDHFLGFLNKLKSLGIYDSSLIILHADHGYYHVPESINQVDLTNLDKQLDRDFKNKEHFAQVVCSCLPLMAIKPPHSNGPLRISRAQTMLTDIPATITSILNLNEKFTGRPVFEIGSKEVRERRFHYYEKMNRQGDAFYDRMDEYIIEGSVFDRASWRLGLTHFSPKKESYQTRKIDFGTKQSSRFLRFGWHFKEMKSNEGLTYNWALGNSASIFLSLPKNEAVRLTANVKTLKFNKPQYVTVKVDNKEIGTWELSPNWVWEKHSIVIEPDEHRANVSVVEFIFSQYRSSTRDLRPLAVLFESLTLSELG